MITETAADFVGWRDRARRLLVAEISPEDVLWTDGKQTSLFGEASAPPPSHKAHGPAKLRVPAAFLETAEIASAHGDPQRFAVLYRLLWKLSHGMPGVLGDPLDADVAQLSGMVRAVREEEHRMHAFVRFRPVSLAAGGPEHWIAWYRPDHHVLERVAPFFARRYPSMHWSLYTPERSAHWDCEEIVFGPGAPGNDAPPPDALDSLFLTYYATVWNPARTNVALLERHVPRRVRAQLPEASAMRALPRTTTARLEAMTQPRISATEALLPEARDLSSLADAARACRACPIGGLAAQTVFGEGPRDARLVIVGEQPGDQEDLAGRPFVGPAGRMLAELMERAGLDRSQIYMTNAVKHFKWEPRGKRRLHSRPNTTEIEACRGWLLAEVEAIRPEMILCLGSTAGQSFSGRGFRVQRDRGQPTSTPWAPWWMATYHPSALFRARSPEERSALESTLLADLVTTRERLAPRSSYGA